MNRYIPTGSVKVMDRKSDAVVYLFERNDVPYAIGYCGKRSKPDFYHRYGSIEAREKHIRTYFVARRHLLQRKEELKIERLRRERGLEVGSILQTSWGYDQTNIEFFQVTRLIGQTMVELRELAQARESEGWCRDKCVPMQDKFIGEPLRRRAAGDGVKIDNVRWAHRWDGAPAHATSYA